MEATLAEPVRTATLAVAAGSAVVAIPLTLFAAHTDVFAPWSLHPLTAATLGAGYAGSVAMSLLAARAGTWGGVRSAALPVLVQLALVVAIPFRPHPGLRLSSGPAVAVVSTGMWLMTNVVLLALVAGSIAAQAQRGFGTRPPGHLPGVAVMVAGGATLAAGGVALYAGHTAHWPWVLGPLDAKALGSWLVADGLGLLTAAREGDLWRVGPGLACLAVTGVLGLLALARYPGALHGTRATAAYVAALAVMALGGSALLALGGPLRTRRV